MTVWWYGWPLGKDQALQALVPVPVGLVVVALALLVLHHVALVVQLLLVHGRQHPAHPVGLQPERQLQVVRRHRLEVVGAVEPGAGVQRAAGALHQLEVPVLGHVLRALEHHVLEEVGEAGPAGLLVPGADAVPQVHRDHRNRRVLREDDLEAVGEGVSLDRDRQQTHGRTTTGPSPSARSGSSMEARSPAITMAMTSVLNHSPATCRTAPASTLSIPATYPLQKSRGMS